jgi:hypothetical protein
MLDPDAAPGHWQNYEIEPNLEEEAGNSHTALVAAQPGGRWAWRQGDADECLLSTA